jgi:hypothetical protein
MTYAQYGSIEASDFNTLVGNNSGNTANALNTTWAIGNNNAGYGQTAVSNVAIGNTVGNLEWDSLINNTRTAAAHQGSTITSVTAPSTGNTIAYISAVTNNLTTIYNNRRNAVAQGTTSSNTIVSANTWTNNLVFTQSAYFANGDAARYFFNAGGQLVITCSHPTGSAVDNIFHGLAANIGNVTLSSPTSGTITIAGNSFSGISKVGGAGQTPATLPNSGYYALTTSNANVFTQTDGVDATFSASYINIQVKTNGTQGSHQDAGNIITFYTTWQEIISSGTTTTTTIGPTTTTTTAGPSYTTSGDTTSSLLYGAHTNSGGAVAMNGTFGGTTNAGTWIYSGTFRSAQVAPDNLSGSWWPLIPTMYGDVSGTLYKQAYCLGTSDIPPVVSPDFAFCWRSSQSNWSNLSIQNMLGFNSAQLANVQTATQVWWNYFLAGMDQSTACGFAILNINDLASGVQNCWDSRQQFYLVDLEDNGTEWADQGFTFTPTVIGSTVTNVGPGSFTHIGNTGRGQMFVLGINGEFDTNLRSDYTITLGPNDLVIPIMKSNNGFSGGIFRGRAQAQFGVMVPAAIPATTTTTSTTTILGTTVSAGTTTTITAIFPSTGNIANTWGEISFTGPPSPLTTNTTSTTSTTTVPPTLDYIYTVPGVYSLAPIPGYPYLTLTMVGGGGGGGGNDGYGDTRAGGGGGSGGYSSIGLNTTGTIGNFFITVAAGGTPANVTFNDIAYPGIPGIPRTGTKSGFSGGQSSVVYSLGNYGAGGGDGGIGNTGDNGDGVGGAGGTGITTAGNPGVTPITDRNIYVAAAGGASVFIGYGAGGASQNSNFGTNLDADLPQAGGNGYVRMQFSNTIPASTTTTTTTAAPVGTINTALFSYLTNSASNTPPSFYEGSQDYAGIFLTLYSTGAFGIVNQNTTSLLDGAPNHNYWVSGAVNPGSSYWVRFTRTAVSGAQPASSSPSTGWLWLYTDQSIFVISGSGGYYGTTEATYTIEVASDASGTNIVATATAVFLSATAYAPPIT